MKSCAFRLDAVGVLGLAMAPSGYAMDQGWRTGKHCGHSTFDLPRQSICGHVDGYEDTHDTEIEAGELKDVWG